MDVRRDLTGDTARERGTGEEVGVVTRGGELPPLLCGGYTEMHMSTAAGSTSKRT